METIPALSVVFRWLHISSVVVLIGSIFYARFFGGVLAPRFRAWIYTAITALVLSGVYTLLTKPELPPGYHIWFGIKMLFVLHIFAVTLLLATPAGEPTKRKRWMTSVVFSALVVIMISSWLRWISLR